MSLIKTSDIMSGLNPTIDRATSVEPGEIKATVARIFTNPRDTTYFVEFNIPRPTDEELEETFNNLMPVQKGYVIMTALAYELVDFWKAIQAKYPDHTVDRRKMREEFSKSTELDNSVAWVFDHLPVELQIVFLKAIIAIHKVPFEVEFLRQTNQYHLEAIKEYIIS